MTARPMERLRLLDIGLLWVASWTSPLTWIARHVGENVSHLRILTLSALIWGVGMGVAWLALRFGVSRTVAVYTTFFAIVLLMMGARILFGVGDVLGWLAIVSVLALLSILLHRIGESGPTRPLVFGLAVALVVGPLASLASAVQEWGTLGVRSGSDVVVDLTHRPDIYLVVVDAYPGFIAEEMDTGDPREGFIAELEASGFQVPRSAWSPYWSTGLTVPSILDMAYPQVNADEGRADRRRRYQMISGDNQLVRVLNDNGYETTMIESGWSGSRCGRFYDRCISGPFLDEGVLTLLAGTVAAPHLSRTYGSAFTGGSLNTMRELKQFAMEGGADSDPRFVFAHLVVPHPPFFLQPDCTTRINAERGGSTFHREGVEPEVREAAFVEQRDCVDLFLRQLTSAVSDEDLLVFVSDHGTDRRSQLAGAGSEWSHEAVVERMNAFLAVRYPGECPIPEGHVTVNLFRVLLACLSGAEIPMTSNRLFVRGFIELDQRYVEALLLGDDVRARRLRESLVGH
jgi:hypothetical protein